MTRTAHQLPEIVTDVAPYALRESYVYVHVEIRQPGYPC